MVGEDDLEWDEHSHGENIGYQRKQLGSSAGGEKLGCSLYEVQPGRRTWPYHYHLANEEAIYVLEDSGTLRIGEEEIGVSKGDYVTLPARAQAAHRGLQRRALEDDRQDVDESHEKPDREN